MNLKRRDFFAAGASAAAIATLPGGIAAPPAAAPDEHYPVGDFILTRTERGLQVSHKQEPDRVIWESEPEGNFIIAERATVSISEFGAPEGTFEISDTVSASYEKPTIEAINAAGNTTTVSGVLTAPTGAIGYKLVFEAVSTTHLRFVISADGSKAFGVNRIRLVVASAKDEAIFGCGEQLTYFNQKGKILPYPRSGAWHRPRSTDYH